MSRPPPPARRRPPALIMKLVVRHAVEPETKFMINAKEGASKRGPGESPAPMRSYFTMVTVIGYE